MSNELIYRSITALFLLAVSSALYFYAPAWLMVTTVVTVACYTLIIEYKPLFLKEYATSYSALIMIGAGFASLLYLHSIAPALFALPFLCAATTDTGSYVAGRLWGKHYINQTISPKKTWEGFAGGYLATMIVLYWWNSYNSDLITWQSTYYIPFWGYSSWGYDNIVINLLLYGFIIAAIGLTGDMLISQLKRNALVKDTGVLLPGHGGILDRFDSILAIAIYIVLCYWQVQHLLTLAFVMPSLIVQFRNIKVYKANQ